MKIKNILQINDSEIDEVNLGLIISNVNRIYSSYLDKKLGEYDITRSQAHFLLGLNEQDHVSQEEICNLFNMTEGTVARTMKRLEDKKLIIRQTNPQDKRKKIIILTDNGKKIVNDIKTIDEEIEKDFCKNISKNQLNQLKLNLKKLAEIINRE